jgi:uncharacterized protein involved in outer membrane biogenesis
MTVPLPSPSRWWRIALIVLGALVALLAIGYVALTRAFPPQRLTAMLADEVQAATGREFRIAGGLSFQLLPTIAVVAKDVSFGNAPWGSRKEMATVKRAAFEVAVAPLLHGQLHVLSVAVDGADVLLETDKQGHPNWIFAGSDKASRAAPAASGATAPPSVNLDRLQLSDARIAYRVGLTQATRSVDIKSLEIVSRGEQTVLSTQFAGEHRQWKLDGKTGRYAVLLQGDSDWPFEAQLSADGAKLTANGSLDTAGTLHATMTARIDKAVALVPLFADAAALPMPIDVSAKLQRSASAVTADAVRLSISGQSLTGKMTVRTDQPTPRIEIDVAASSLDLAQWGVGKPTAAAKPAPANKGPVFADTPLPAITLPEIPLRAHVRLDRLAAPGMPPLSTVKAEITVEPDRLVVEPLSLTVAGGQLQARLELGTRRGEPLRVKLRADANALSLQSLDEVINGRDGRVRGGRVKLRANLDVAGHSPHALAASANGNVLLSVADVRVLGSASVMQRNVIVTLLQALLPKQEGDQSVQIQCAVVNLPLRSGVAKIDRSIAMETDKLAVAASGELNLAAQTVTLTFRPAVKKGLGLDPASLANLVMLDGPLHDPKIGIDMKGTAREAATIGAAVATAGLTLVGKRLLSGPAETQTCRQAMSPAAP